MTFYDGASSELRRRQRSPCWLHVRTRTDQKIEHRCMHAAGILEEAADGDSCGASIGSQLKRGLVGCCAFTASPTHHRACLACVESQYFTAYDTMMELFVYVRYPIVSWRGSETESTCVA